MIYCIAGNFRGWKLSWFGWSRAIRELKLSRITKATPHMRTYVQKFADKTFTEGGYEAKFAKVSRYTVLCGREMNNR